MRYLDSLIPVLSAILACTPTAGTGTDSETSTATGTDSHTSTGTSTTTTGDLTTGQPTTGDSTTSTATTEGTTTGTGTTEATTTDPGTGTTEATTTGTGTTEDTTDSTGSSTTGDPGNVEYAAFILFGGLDRLIVRKADHDADLCTSVRFLWPGGAPDPEFMLPGQWGFDFGEIAQGTADCLVFNGALPDTIVAETAMGSGTWPAQDYCPDSNIDIDVTLHFPAGDPWVPAQSTLTATGVPLQGC